MNVEKNWLEEMVKSSDFEYFDGNDEYLEVVAGQGKDSGSVLNNLEVVAGQGKGSGNNVVYRAVPITTMPVEKRPLLTTMPVEKRPLRASANPFNNPASYKRISSVFFDIIVETKLTNVKTKQPDVEVPILYPYMNHNQGYEKVLARYGLILADYYIYYEDDTCKIKRYVPTSESMDGTRTGDIDISIKGMSFNLSDLHNAILYRNLKLQINKIRFALQEPDDIAYLNTLTMYSIGITSKIQKDSLNTGSFVRPWNYNNNIVDVDMEIVVDYNNILTYTINPGLVNLDELGNGQNTFRMSFFCNVLK